MQVDRVRWSWRQAEERGEEGKKKEIKKEKGRSYHDITSLLCHYVLEQHSLSSTLGVVQGSQNGGGRGAWSIRVPEVEFLNHCWGMDFSMGEPHVI